MDFSLTPQYEAAILRQYQQNITAYPLAQKEVEAYLQTADASQAICLKYLYGHMAAQDVLSFPVTLFAAYVKATLDACRQLEYLKTIPPEIFFPYVLQHRVNSECLDDSRGFLLRELLPHVRGKSMEQAALAVNYWCYAHATYTPADDRTLGPLAVIQRTFGRCGEESVLAVAALRSVGIPARQCYCPRWSHCDDNHAWVEVWICGRWHYLGACEPEEALDLGWFTSAASRAMLVDTKCWDGDGLYKTVNCTAHYADSRQLTVGVTDGGLPVAGASVRFQNINYSELYTLWEETTDENGLARFSTGKGDLMVYVQLGQKVALQKVDLRQQTAVTLALEDAFPGQLKVDLMPPEDRSIVTPYEPTPEHAQLLALCQSHLAARRADFAGAEGYLRQATRNGAALGAFLEDRRYSQAQKDALLRTLRPKDFADITCDVLIDALETPRGQYSEDIWTDFVLAPRICDEMLLPHRKAIRELFPQGFESPEEILHWMKIRMQILPDQGVSHYYPSALGCLRHRQVPVFAFDMVFVALCRSFGFPARLKSADGCAQWLDGRGSWHSIAPESPALGLTIQIPEGKKLQYFEHFTLGRWDGRDFVTLKYPDLAMEGSHRFDLQPGLYRVTLTTRQIDGTASVALWHIDLREDTTLPVIPPADQTAQRLKQIPLVLPEGALREQLNAHPNGNRILIFADPGSEPTEHLLTEMLACAEEFQALSSRILLLVEDAQMALHPTVQQLKAALPKTEVLPLPDSPALTALRSQMQIGDLRLPFVLCTDRLGHGAYAAANYQIRMAQTLLEVQKLLTSHL